MDRALEQIILQDLKKKLVILMGPRQVGKTWLAKKILKHYNKPQYLNYDSLDDRKIIQERSWLFSSDLLVFDELHKMPDWKNYIKGIYDTKAESTHILLTGSARLDAYRYAGDSLLGRFFAHRLLPLSLSEVKEASLAHFLERGGYPEPFLAESRVEAERWRMQYLDGIIQTDVLDFENIHNLKTLKTLLELLRHRVGSPISYSGLAEDLQVSPNTVKKYIAIFEALFIVFKISPFSKNIARSLLKEPKIYFYDTGLVKGNEGLQFENFVAVSLLKHCYTSYDVFAENRSLHYVRTKDRKEVDFCLVKDDSLECLIEAKLQNPKISKALRYFHEKYQHKAIQLVAHLRNEYKDGAIKILKAEDFLRDLHG